MRCGNFTPHYYSFSCGTIMIMIGNDNGNHDGDALCWPVTVPSLYCSSCVIRRANQHHQFGFVTWTKFTLDVYSSISSMMISGPLYKPNTHVWLFVNNTMAFFDIKDIVQIRAVVCYVLLLDDQRMLVHLIMHD